MYKVYKHTNLINGKSYIGITSQKTYKRWHPDHYISCKRFYAAIEEFGWQNFSHEVLYEVETKEEANKLEKEMIAQYKTTEAAFGYNMSSGGIGRSGLKSKGGVKRKRVLCIETGIIYESLREAGRQTATCNGDISKCCRGLKKTAGGYHWRYID